MIEVLSKIILDYLIKNDMIENSDDDYDHYRYGVEITISSFINLILVIIIGCLIKRILYSIIFLTIFISLRQLTGGYHAKTYLRCNLTMCCSFSFVAFGTSIIKIFPLQFFLIHTILSTSIVLLYCPVENENKPIALEAQSIYKSLAVITSLLISNIGYLLGLKYNEYGTCIILTIIIINILIIASQIKRGEKNENQN